MARLAGESGFDAVPLQRITEEEAYAAAITICDTAVRLQASVEDTKLVLEQLLGPEWLEYLQPNILVE